MWIMKIIRSRPKLTADNRRGSRRWRCTLATIVCLAVGALTLIPWGYDMKNLAAEPLLAQSAGSLIATASPAAPAPAPEKARVSVPAPAPTCDFPTIPADHAHARALLDNAMRYLAVESRTTDPTSGYPVEGWNDDPSKGLCLRCFTQLTAIGQWAEVLADVAAGSADTPYLSRREARQRLALVVESLRHDQKDPQVSAKGLMGAFLDLAPGRRMGALTGEVEKRRFLEAFGPQRGEAAWKALQAKGWLLPTSNGREATVSRSAGYGAAHFDGPLTPFADEPTKLKIMGLLDQRVVMVVFGDNANLSTSIGKAIGALLSPSIKDDPQIIALRQKLEAFLEDQREGYAHLYDAKVGLFNFGWDATRNRLYGWEDAAGNWQAGHMDYLVNEFRGPATFVVLRHGLPLSAIKNLGFKIKPYQARNGSDAYALAPWEGSAFQALGLGISMMELRNPSWRRILTTVVDIELDYADRNRLPGFLSESYTGEGTQYTGSVGIPEIAVTDAPRITDVASLYTLGVAYSVAPDKVEGFLAKNWKTVSTLLTDHGPWEGYNMAKHEIVRVQTSAHTLALILGLVGTGSENMNRYLEFKGLGPRLAETYKPGEKFDFLSPETKVFAWVNDGAIQQARSGGAFAVKGDRVNQLGIAFVPARPAGVNLSNGLLTIRYRSARPMERVVLGFKPLGTTPDGTPQIPNELFTRFAGTDNKEKEIQVSLPATPGLVGVKELVITCGQKGPVDMAITGLTFTPYSE